MRQAKQLCKELMIGLIIWAVPVALILTIVATHRLAMLAGVLLGAAVAAGLLLHMYHHLDIALDMDEKHAQRHTQFAVMQRMFIMGIVLALSMIFPEYIYPVGVVFGLFGMKTTVFMYPMLHRHLEKRKKK